MDKRTAIKRVVFWIEIAVAATFFFVGVFLAFTIILESGDPVENLIALVTISGYLFVTALASILKVPSVSFSVIAGLGIYFGTLYYFAETEVEKKWRKFVIPIAAIGFSLTAIVLIAYAMSGLAMQGAGK